MRTRKTREHYGAVAILLHWGMAAVILGMFGLGLYMRSLTYYDPLYRVLPEIHKSIGVVLFGALIVRLLWRSLTPSVTAVGQHSSWERMAARMTHAALYLLILAIVASGYLISTADGRPLQIFGDIGVPALFTHKGLEDTAGTIHLMLAITLITLAALHAGAALKHHFVDKDRTLLRMLGR